MRFLFVTVLAAAAFASAPSFAENSGASILSYETGTGFSEGYTDATAALGSPSRSTPGDFGGPVTPFSPPWQQDQLVSVGEGGSIVIEMSAPVFDDPAHAFGRDFIIFGNSGFTIMDFAAEVHRTDGSLFGQTTGEARVSVSRDNETYFSLNPESAPVPDGLYPTDGSGNFTLPVDPALEQSDFAGKSLEEVRDLYASSGGGTAFDIGWAIDENNQAAGLDQVRFVRIDVLSDKVDIDGIVAVPEPSTEALAVMAAGVIGMICIGRRLAGLVMKS